MVTKIFLIRHGETEDSDVKKYKGHIDVQLSDNGIRQIKILSDYLVQDSSALFNYSSTPGQQKPAAVYTSDLGRAIKSADIIAEPHGLKPVIVKGLRERSFGGWEGMTFDDIKEKYPEAFDKWADNPLKFSPLNGESTIDVRQRAMKAFNEIVKKHDGENIVIVAHGGINRILICELLGIPLENIFRIEQDFGCLNVIEMWDYPVVKLLNFIV